MVRNPLPPSLPLRLRRVAELVPAGSRVIDVGTDHALLPIHLVATGRCPAALARDLRKGPADVARRNIRRSGLSDRISTEVADGLDGLETGPEDAIVIAGLGGLETADILARSPEAARAAGSLVLQPMKSLPELRGWLEGQGYAIGREELVLDGGRHYVVLRCRWDPEASGKSAAADPLERLLGKDLLDRRPEGFAGYLRWVRRRLEKERKGLASSADPADADRARLHSELIARIDAIEYNE